MNKKQLIDLGLDEEMAKKVATESEEELKSFIPKAEFDVVAGERDSANALIKERDAQLEQLKSVNVEDLQAQITSLQEENKLKDENYAKEVKELKINNAVESALTKSGALNMKAVKALLDVDAEKITVKEDGTLEGLNLDEQIKALKSADDSKFMFKDDGITLKGANPSKLKPTEGEGTNGADLSKMSYDELSKYFNENPDVQV